jgi:hypothetical protein
MSVYHWILLTGFTIFIISMILLLYGLSVKRVHDPSPARGNSHLGITYSLTKAMSPFKKESAIKHLPTYIAGLIYHLGTFLCFFLLIFFFFDFRPPLWLSHISIFISLISSICGIGILIKRMVLVKLRTLSNPDDYISNLLVTGFQIITGLTLLLNLNSPLLFIYSALLLLYIPVGKLRHSIFFFTSRVQLGKFYGKRGIWPIK